MNDGPLDLATLDRRIARAHGAIEQALAGVANPDDRAAALSVEDRKTLANGFSGTFAGIRDIAGQSTFRAVRELPAAAGQEVLKDGLLRWIHELVQLRIAWDLLVDAAEAGRAPDPRLARPKADARGGVIATFDDALSAIVDAPHLASATEAFQRLEELASPVAAVRNEMRARRFEVASRLDLDHPWNLATGAPAAALGERAQRLLDATEPLAVELHKRTQRAAGVARSAALGIDAAFARDAREGWPSRLGARWLEESFGTLFPRSPRSLRIPRAAAGASFLRAADVWGRAQRHAMTSRALPFTVSRDPYPNEAHMFGGALAIAVTDRVFARRRLGLPARQADAHERTLARVLFLTLRTSAAVLALGVPAQPETSWIEELGARVFGAPLAGEVGAAWANGGFSGASRVDAPARFVGAVRAFGLVQRLKERFDEDWFDNPRASAHLASIGVGPIWQGDLPPEEVATAIARRFEESLG
jgi:hypothetical protein